MGLIWSQRKGNPKKEDDLFCGSSGRMSLKFRSYYYPPHLLSGHVYYQRISSPLQKETGTLKRSLFFPHTHQRTGRSAYHHTHHGELLSPPNQVTNKSPTNPPSPYSSHAHLYPKSKDTP
ncbi:hypothetical protein VTJ04DRAFT_4557 [Mycothermus thermophilus]|uniref:uncharacterized protein n=1 Tax=Humicola insolens TaxID=85995 RepID=UPI0037442082